LKQTNKQNFFLVRAIFFDKNPEANWSVPWHQDLAIAVEKQIETPGFTGWSVKDGTLHVHPPEEVLANMITMRLHLDDCDAGNGALKVIASSHLAGKIPSNEISRWAGEKEQTVCEVSKGGVLLMRPLLLHSSSPAESPRHRRVLHIEYATQELPNGLKWLDN
jgi:ectoine hydroxylase-related dioxygenase (phytanoyl-CoA dioxygenase family)